MFLFQTPPPTRFDLNFSLFGIPVRVHPLFWLIAIIFGSAANTLIGILIWVVAVFISIMIHELGHALAMRRYGQTSHIILHMAGGLTVPESMAWGNTYANVAMTPNQQIFISLAGPFAGFLFAGLILMACKLAGGLIQISFLLGFIPLANVFLPNGGEILNALVTSLLWVNIFWGIINLMPVYPLDGGNVSRYVLIQVDPLGGARTSLWLSVIVGAMIALAGLFLFRSIYMAILFGMLAFQSYQSLQYRF
jgi:membrane-associated protease RseP (regulator of RpoE activity)